MLVIDENIVTIDNKICSYLDSIDSESRGAISQDILAQLIHLVEQVMLKFYAGDRDIDDTDDNIAAAMEFSQTNGELKTLYRFRNYLQIVAAHSTLDGNASERLMLKYYQYLLETRKLLRKYFNMQILHNLNKFPLNLDSALQEYYAKIAYKIEQHPANFSDKGNKYYIQKIKPFFVGNEIYYEVTFTPVSGKNSKTNMTHNGMILNILASQKREILSFVFPFFKLRMKMRMTIAVRRERLFRFKLLMLFPSIKHKV